MARLPALVEAISKHDLRGAQLIGHIARLVRDEELIVSRGRGTAAAAMTFADAATLLMAVGSSRIAMDAPQGVRNLRGLRLRPIDDDLDQEQGRFGDPRLSFFSQQLPFATLLERMIENAPALKAWEADYLARTDAKGSGLEEAEYGMRRLLDAVDRARDPVVPGFARAVRIVTYAPGCAAEVHLGWPWSTFSDREAVHRLFLPDVEVEPVPDVLIAFEIGTPTLLALFDAVNEPSLNPRHMPRT